MAISGPPTGGTGPSLAGPALAGRQALAQQELRLPGQRDAWTYCVSPTKLQCVSGRILPELAKAWHTPGINGNPAGTNRGAGFISNLVAIGFQPVPHDLDCVAFGESRAGSPVSTYLDRHVGIDGDRRRVVYYSDAWTRPKRIGHLVRWERDHAGWLDFLDQCLALVCPTGELEPLQIELAMEPVIRRIRTAQDREDSRGRRMVDALLAQVPHEHLPPDLADLAAERAEQAKGKTKTKSRKG